MAVSDVSFSVQAEIVGFLGPNGAGTTALRVLTGFYPDVGTAQLRVRRRRAIVEARRASVPAQSAAIYRRCGPQYSPTARGWKVSAAWR